IIMAGNREDYSTGTPDFIENRRHAVIFEPRVSENFWPSGTRETRMLLMRRGQTMVRAEPFWQLRRCQQELGVYATRRRGFLAGLLIATIFVGSIDVALRFVADSQPQKEKPAFAKIQDRMISAAEPDTAKSLQTSQQSDSSRKSVLQMWRLSAS